MTAKRKIRIFIVAPDSDLCLGIQEVCSMEEYKYFHSSTSDALNVVHEVFLPDIVITFWMRDYETASVLNYFARFDTPILLITPSRDRDYHRRLIHDYAPNIEIVTMPFTVEEFLENLELMAKPIQADIDWFNGVYRPWRYRR